MQWSGLDLDGHLISMSDPDALAARLATHNERIRRRRPDRRAHPEAALLPPILWIDDRQPRAQRR